MADVLVIIDEEGLAGLFSPAGPIAAFVAETTQRVHARAQERAPVGAPSKTPEGHPSGWLRSQISWVLVGDLEGMVSTSAVNSVAAPRPGDPYARWIERPNERPFAPPPFARGDRPYLVPALDDIIRDLGGR
ncbi:hypothetical protein [Kineosporia sp. NBRC 101731]|uniref:hypothetical protein n=1 Tax=Kineosporia sp. NBRC 101731 TaxID=3032199 RepID=UPI0024A1763A|nr:hypothetical protein [Kineosporia sp. NBRC 101731]GLY32132.1 hypothetical protein Kisp02_54970 [Kineosporia sp. NBRC 101731]